MMDLPETTRHAQGRIVYVVEDNAEIGRLVCATLDEHGFQSEHFLTGAHFLHRLKRKQPAVAVIDLGLPDLDGLQLIRDVQSVADSAILVLTGRQSVSDRILGLELGADDYMVKPFEPREVVARVNTILRRLERSGEPRKGAHRGRPPEEGYHAVGQSLLALSDVLIAIWDGEGSRGKGGTVEVIEAARERGIPVVWVHASKAQDPKWLTAARRHRPLRLPRPLNAASRARRA